MDSAKNKKLVWLLILQGWTMLWVVVGHAPLDSPTTGVMVDNISHDVANILCEFAYSFHMPLFIMISGYLFYMTRIAKGWKMGEMLYEKFLRLGIPYLFFITVAIILKVLMPGEVNRPTSIDAMGLAINYLQPFNGALNEMWFVATIFVYFLFYPIYPLLLKTKWTIGLYLLVGCVMFYIPMGWFTQWFAIGTVIHFFIYFFVGMVIRKLSLETYLSNWRLICCFGLMYIFSFWWQNGLLTALSASFAFWGLAIIIDRSLTGDLFHSFRNYTYQIFLIGIFVQMFMKVMARKIEFPGSYAIWWLLSVLLGIYFPVMLSKMSFLNKYPKLKYLVGL